MILHKYGKIILGFCDNVKTNPDRCLWKHPYFRDIKRLYISFWGWFCSHEDFIRHSSPLFSAAAELRSLTPNLLCSNLCSRACPHL